MLYYNLIQDPSVQHKARDRAEQQFTQILLSDGGQKKTAVKQNPWGKNLHEIWGGTMTQALNSPTYEATKFKHIYLHCLKEHYPWKKEKIKKVKQAVGLE